MNFRINKVKSHNSLTDKTNKSFLSSMSKNLNSVQLNQQNRKNKNINMNCWSDHYLDKSVNIFGDYVNFTHHTYKWFIRVEFGQLCLCRAVILALLQSLVLSILLNLLRPGIFPWFNFTEICVQNNLIILLLFVQWHKQKQKMTKKLFTKFTIYE